MSRVYRNVCTYIWNDDKFPFASDDVQLLWFHIFTNPLSSPLGVFRATIGGLAEDKNRNGQWPEERYRHAFREAMELGLLDYDAKALLIAFPKFFSGTQTPNHPISPNQLKAWGERFNELPTSYLKDNCYQSLKAILVDKAKGMLDAFLDAFTLPSAMASAIPDPNPNPKTNPNPEPKPDKKEKSSGETKIISPPTTGILAWEAYSSAYQIRYGANPVRNQTTNSQLKNFVKRVGQEEAAQIAAFYVTHNGQFYVTKMHPVSLLLNDAEKLRTEWATGKRMTKLEAKGAEQQDEAREQVKRVERMLKGGL